MAYNDPFCLVILSSNFSIHLSRLRSPVHQMVWFMLVMPSVSCTHPRSPLYLHTCLRPRLTRLSSSSPTAMWPAPRDYNLALGTYSSLEGIIILVLYCIQFPRIFTPCACARGKALGLYVCCCRRHCPHENRQFGHSRPLSDL